MAFEEILYDVDDGVLTITLNRPDRLNAFTATMMNELLDTARSLAREIGDNTAPVSVAMSRRMLWTMLGAGHPMDAHRADSRAMFARGQSDDAREGVTSFLEKRPARFPDRVSDGLPDIFPGRELPVFS